jgi:dTDP-4-amino-4,6-dideoxygalactose transaminase
MNKDWMSIPFVDIAGQHSVLKDELLRATDEVLTAGQFILGKQVEEFERVFADRCGVPFAIGVNSGTDALILALRVLGIGPGDEVITVPNTFVATVSAIALVGATPVLVDVRDDMNMDPALLESAITQRTKALIPVHLTGRPADMQPIMDIAFRRGLFVIEDAAQAILAKYDNRPVGTFGNLGCFSLHPLKTLNACGDGGVITSQDESLTRKLRILRNIGLETRENAVQWSGNSRLDTLQAAFLLVKMKHLDSWTRRRQANAVMYQKLLTDIPEVIVPIGGPREECVYHTFVIQCQKRDQLKNFLAEKGIGTAIHYPIPIHLQTAAKALGYKKGAFPVSERIADTILSLPVYPELARTQLEFVAQQIRKFYAV